MLPDTKNAPTFFPIVLGNYSISRFVACDLRFPILYLALWHNAVFCTPVPKASIYEYDNFLLSEQKVRGADSSFLMPSPPSNFVFSQQCRELRFSSEIALAANSSHVSAALFLRMPVHSSLLKLMVKVSAFRKFDVWDPQRFVSPTLTCLAF